MTQPTFDWNECLRLSNNKESLAKDLLDMLEKELPSYQVGLKKEIQANNLEKLGQQVHKLHGACCYTGVPRLKQLTEQLESQIKSHKKDQLVSLVQQIDQEINAVLKAIKNR